MTKPRFILIDPGHGGDDPGAVGFFPEAKVNLLAALELARALGARGCRVMLTRYFDIDGPSLADRCARAVATEPDLYVSLHCNGADDTRARGFEIWTSPGQTPSDDAATSIFAAVSQACPERVFRSDVSDGDPDKESKFRVLVGHPYPAVLLELGFITNPGEAHQLIDGAWRRRHVDAIADGIVSWLSRNPSPRGVA